MPDLFIILPGIGTVAIEMKRLKGGTVSPAQKQWQELLNATPGTDAHVCRGAEAAIAVIESYLIK